MVDALCSTSFFSDAAEEHVASLFGIVNLVQQGAEGTCWLYGNVERPLNQATDGGRGNRACTKQFGFQEQPFAELTLGCVQVNGTNCPYEQCLPLTSTNLHNSHCWPLEWLLLALSTTTGSIQALPPSLFCSSD
jgi:hypothetical protein